MFNIFSRLKLNNGAVLIAAAVIVVGGIAYKPDQGVIIGTIGTLLFTQLLKMMQDAQTAEQQASIIRAASLQASLDAKAAREQSDIAAVKIDNIGEVVRDTNDTGKTTLGYVNSAMGAVLLDRALDREQIAKLTGTKESAELASTARATYDKHMAQQAIVNPPRNHTVEALLPEPMGQREAVEVEHLQDTALGQIMEAATPGIEEKIDEVVESKLDTTMP